MANPSFKSFIEKCVRGISQAQLFESADGELEQMFTVQAVSLRICVCTLDC